MPSLNCIYVKFWGNLVATATLFTVFCVCVLALYEKDFGGHSAIYWEVKYPFPLSNRDVSFRQTAFRCQSHESRQVGPLTNQRPVRVREGAQRPGRGREEDLGHPGPQLPGGAVSGEERSRAGQGLPPEPGDGERRRPGDER